MLSVEFPCLHLFLLSFCVSSLSFSVLAIQKMGFCLQLEVAFRFFLAVRFGSFAHGSSLKFVLAARSGWGRCCEDWGLGVFFGVRDCRRRFNRGGSEGGL